MIASPFVLKTQRVDQTVDLATADLRQPGEHQVLLLDVVEAVDEVP